MGIFSGLFDTSSTQTISVRNFLICIIAALAIGFLLAFVHGMKNRCSQSFLITLAIIPAVTCMIIMLVNGNVGAGVAVAGAFSLIRFRSVPGTAREIGSIFIAMGAGLTCGMGYIAFAILFSIILCAVTMLCDYFDFGVSKKELARKSLHITIPEDLDYTDVFDDLFDKYTVSSKLVSVKTTNMGSLFKLVYDIELKTLDQEKNFIDDLRCRNGNLEISITPQSTLSYEL